MKDFIKGGDIVVKSEDPESRKRVTQYLQDLQIDFWIDEVIENTIKTGNGYLELDFADQNWKHPSRCYPIADSSRIYINCNEFGEPKRKSVVINDAITGEPKLVEVPDGDKFYVQRIDAGFNHPRAEWFDMTYHFGSLFKRFRVYGIPMPFQKLIHFRLNIGDTGIYGRSYLASALNDYETLKQIERSIAVIAKYKAVPRDIIMYGDKDNPATDDELDSFILYLESLEKEDSAIVNKPIKRESLAYAGQDINLDYMINHIRKKIIAGIAPDFMMGLGNEVSKSTAQISLISYILAIYSKRKLFLKPIENIIMQPFIEKNGLQPCWLEFGELDFETKSEKANRIGSLWVQNILTLNQTLKKLGEDPIGTKGDVYYLEWQSTMMNQGGGMFGGQSGFGVTPELPPQDNDEDALPNGEDVNKVFSHNPPSNATTVSRGGKMPHDPYQPADKPKFLPKNDTKPLGETMKEHVRFDITPKDY
jgi:hypothetical protein